MAINRQYNECEKVKSYLQLHILCIHPNVYYAIDDFILVYIMLYE